MNALNHPAGLRRRPCFARLPFLFRPIPLRRLLLLGLALALALPGANPVLAQEGGTGTITGRVQNQATGDYLGNARVSLAGTNRSVTTTDGGFYTLTNVPVGPAAVEVTYAGLEPQTATVTVGPGVAATQDFHLGRPGETTVVLDTYTVQSTRETSASMIAVNEQRNHGNITSVVSTEEFGTQVDKNPGEFLKWLPGVDVETFANNIVGVSVRGLGSANTELLFDGLPQASMNAEAVGRSFEVQFASAADISRVEIRKLPLPQDSSNALGGAINLVRRSAFEYSKRQVKYQVIFAADGEDFTFRNIDGPKDQLRDRWRPNWELKWTEPLSSNFGFAVTVGKNDNIANTHWTIPGFNRGSAANNALVKAALDAGQTPPNIPSIFTPAVSSPLNHNAPLRQGKKYGSIRFDWRATPELTFGYSFNYTKGFKEVADDIRYRWNAAATGSGNAVRAFDDTNSLGRVGGGAIFHDNPLWRDINAPTLTNTFDATWKKGDWEIKGSAVWSRSDYDYRDTSHGFFNSTSVANVTGLVNIPHTGVGAGTANPIPLTVDFHGITPLNFGSVEAFTTASGKTSTNIADFTVPVAWDQNSATRIGGARSRPGDSHEIVTAFKFYADRQFNLENPLSIRLGFDYTEKFRNRTYDSLAWRFVGKDGIPNSIDDSTTLIAADKLKARPDSFFGFPGSERISLSKLHDLFEQNPTWFQFDEARSARLSLTQNPKYDLRETILAPYGQFNWQLFKNRLKLTGGVRYEDNTGKAHGLKIDNSAALLKYADGSSVHVGDLDAAGQPLVKNLGSSTSVNYVLLNANALPATRLGAPVFNAAIQAAGNADRAAGRTTDTGTNLGRGSLLATQTIYTAKGAYQKGGNDNFFPSLHTTYDFSDNLVLQVGYAKTQAQNRFDRSVIPQNEITENSLNSTTGTQALGRIRMRNKDLKPWTGDNLEARLSYYTKQGGVFGVGLFRKYIHDFQREIISAPLTEEQAADLAENSPELGLGLDAAGFELQTFQNVGNAKVDGAEFEMRQSLDPFLPHALRGFQFFGTASYTNLKGQPAGGDFNGLSDYRITTNLGYRSRRFSANFGYIRNGPRTTNGAVTSNGLVGEQVNLAQNLYSFKVEYRVNKWANFFISGENIGDEARLAVQRFDEQPADRSFTTSNSFGITYTFGITGSF